MTLVVIFLGMIGGMLSTGAFWAEILIMTELQGDNHAITCTLIFLERLEKCY